jgi:predicted permease
MLEQIVQDLRYGARILAKSPGFTAVAALSLALGIGANTSIFTLIDAVLLKTLPVREPERLVTFFWAAKDWPEAAKSMTGSSWRDAGKSTGTSLSYPAFEQIRARNTTLSAVFAFAGIGRATVAVDGQAAHANGQMVSADYFTGLGLQPAAGRFLTTDDDKEGAPGVAVISYAYWQRRFGGDAAAVGKAVTVNGTPFTVVGVTPPEFFGLSPGEAIEVSVPLATQPLVAPRFMGGDAGIFKKPDRWWVILMGRLKPGVTRAQALAELDVIFRQAALEGFTPPTDRPANNPWLELQPGGNGLDSLRRQFSKPLSILMAVVGVVLLIACANVANLLLARAAARQREIAVRLSIGTTRARLVLQLLTEGVLLALLGTLLGIGFAYWGTQVLVGWLTRGGNRLVLDLAPDLRVLAFTVGACGLTALLFGLAPALRASRVDMMTVLRESAGGQGGGRLRLGLAKGLVVAQVALSLVLLAGAGLFVRTLLNLRGQEVGFAQDNLLQFGINPTQAGYSGARLADFYQRMHERILAVPGVAGTTMSLIPLLSNGSRTSGVKIEGMPAPTVRQQQAGTFSTRVLTVGPKFFETMKIPVWLGRDFTPGDDEKAPKVAIVNQTFARRFYGVDDAVGKRFGWMRSEQTDFEIVGIAKDARYESLRRDIQPTIYLPIRQDLAGLSSLNFYVRGKSDPRRLIASVRAAVEELDRNLPLFNVRTLEEQIDELLLQERLFAKLTTFFGAIALLLACVGLYGILSYAVAKRTGEIGIRMALGAARSDIVSMVLRETLLLIGVGAVIGMPAAWGAAKSASSAISGMLFQLDPTDAVTIVGGAIVMAACAAVAGFLPARRASGVDPMVALRCE